MSKPIIFESTINTSEGSIQKAFQLRSKLVYITNDSSDYDLLVNFDGTIGESGTFTIRAGESISDIPISVNYICMQAINGSVPVRCLGV